MRNFAIFTLLMTACFAQPAAQACNGPGCQDGYNEALVGRCLKAISENNCSVTTGNRIAICKDVQSARAVEAVRKAFAPTCSISDSTLSNLVRIDGPRSLGCVNAIIENNCAIDTGNRAEICRSTRSFDAVAAVRLAFQPTCSISDTTLSNLVAIQNHFQLGCVSAIVNNNCGINVGARARICLRTCTQTAVDMIDDMFRPTCTVSDRALSAVASIGQ